MNTVEFIKTGLKFLNLRTVLLSSQLRAPVQDVNKVSILPARKVNTAKTVALLFAFPVRSYS
jgi:hypothetical protein